MVKAYGLSLALAGRVDEGIEACRKAAALAPMDPECRYAYGYALGAAKRYEEAIPEMDAALFLAPNHLPAKQGLVYCLVSASPFHEDEDPQRAEQYLDRAYKLDSHNPQLLAVLLDFLIRRHQVGKAIRLYQTTDDRVRAHVAMQPVIAKLESDPAFQRAFRQANMAQQSALPNASPVAPGQALKQVPCPNCRHLIMDYAAICPHCNFKIRATGSFADKDQISDFIWQELALTIIAIVWCLIAIKDVYMGLQIKEDGMRAFFTTIAVGELGIGVGLLARQDWIGFIAKIFCWLSLGFGVYSFMINWFGLHHVLMALLDVFKMGVTGLLIYLIGYTMD
jgi:tetratricopeptide (TPR) repeat protein